MGRERGEEEAEEIGTEEKRNERVGRRGKEWIKKWKGSVSY